ncbi:D-alanyl-D-alanine dipeptidase [Xanthomonas oryzae pv. oryzae]|nr:D-alanyl-D-alanine dipeptidase [Xanthomonas oryzae pv. oryzae]
MKETLLFRKGRCWRQLFLQGALLMIAMAPSALVASDVHVSSAKTAAEAGLVDVHALAPDIALDMRHASSNNFTGQVVPGCNAPRCYLLQPAAEALARVAHTLEAEGDRLQVSDCYRPVRSVKAFVAWAADLQNQTTRAQYYPRVDKRVLLGDYIAPTSGHRRGATLDLGLLQCRSAACQAVDMGTGFDVFDARAHTDAPDISVGQRAHRQRLRRAMAAEGFANYPMEWWHFTFRPEPTPDTAYAVSVD